MDDYVEALDYVIGLIGEDLVGIGSDASEGHGRPSDFMAWCNKVSPICSAGGSFSIGLC